MTSISYEEAKKWLEAHTHRYFDEKSTPDEFAILKKFFKQHPKYNDWKLQNCVAFKITRSPKKKYIQTYVKVSAKNKDETAQQNGGSWRIVSWRSCIFQKIPNSAPPLTQAMRNAIKPQIAAYNKTNSFGIRKCEICGCENNNKLEVDHYPNRFADIKNEFLKQTKWKNPTKFAWSRTNGNYIFDNSTYSVLFRRDWEKFHHSKANYRLLCGDCNKKN